MPIPGGGVYVVTSCLVPCSFQGRLSAGSLCQGGSVWGRSLSRGMSVQRLPVNRQTGVKTLPSLAVGNYNNFTFKLNLLHTHLHLELHLLSLEAANKWIIAWWRYILCNLLITVVLSNLSGNSFRLAWNL